MRQLDQEKLKVPEEFYLTQDIYVREHGQTKAVGKKAGSKVTVSGMDKAELVYRGIAVTADHLVSVLPHKGDGLAVGVAPLIQVFANQIRHAGIKPEKRGD